MMGVNIIRVSAIILGCFTNGIAIRKAMDFFHDKGFKLGKHYPCEYYHPTKDDLEVNYLFTY